MLRENKDAWKGTRGGYHSFCYSGSPGTSSLQAQTPLHHRGGGKSRVIFIATLPPSHSLSYVHLLWKGLKLSEVILNLCSEMLKELSSVFCVASSAPTKLACLPQGRRRSQTVCPHREWEASAACPLPQAIQYWHLGSSPHDSLQRQYGNGYHSQAL